MSNKNRHNFDEVIERQNTDAKKYHKFPKGVIPMWIAETDFKCPQPVVDAMINRAEHGLYGYVLESNSFNRAVQNWMKQRFAWDIEEAWVEYAPAVVPAIVNAIQAFTHPGDKVLIQTPVYHPFHSIIPNSGRIAVKNKLIHKDNRYELDFKDLEEKLQDPRTKMMILCNPHNPLGRVFRHDELLKIGELCLKHDVLVVSDEIHSDLVYAGHKHIPFPTLSKEIEEISLVCINPSKTFNLAGVRTAGVIVPNQKLRQIYREQLISNRANGRTIFGVLAFEVAYNDCAYYVDELMDYLSSNLSFLKDFIAKRIPKIKATEMEATYLIWLDCRELGMTDAELHRFFLEEAKVGLSEGSAFGEEGEGFMRMNIGCRRAVLEEALHRIENAINHL